VLNDNHLTRADDFCIFLRMVHFLNNGEIYICNSKVLIVTP